MTPRLWLSRVRLAVNGWRACQMPAGWFGIDFAVDSGYEAMPMNEQNIIYIRRRRWWHRTLF